MSGLENVFGVGGNMPDPEHTRRLENDVRLHNALASALQGVDQRFRAMERRIAELEQLYVHERTENE